MGLVMALVESDGRKDGAYVRTNGYRDVASLQTDGCFRSTGRRVGAGIWSDKNVIRAVRARNYGERNCVCLLMVVQIPLVYGVVEVLPWFDPVHAFMEPALELIVMVVKKTINARTKAGGLCVRTEGL